MNDGIWIRSWIKISHFFFSIINRRDGFRKKVKVSDYYTTPLNFSTSLIYFVIFFIFNNFFSWLYFGTFKHFIKVRLSYYFYSIIFQQYTFIL